MAPSAAPMGILQRRRIEAEIIRPIYETMKHAKELFPPDLDYKIVYDTTPAVQASIESIVHTFVEAVILVTIVVFCAIMLGLALL